MDFAVGGRPSRFFKLEADWERFSRFIAYVASLPSDERPAESEVRARLDHWLPRRPGWVDELMVAYRGGLNAADGVDGPPPG